ncbi:MAG: hypothetical protein Aurels2KO_28060 [Aureliella sp.]
MRVASFWLDDSQRKLAGIVAIPLVWFILSLFAKYEQHWKSGDTTYRDTYRFWTAGISHRHVSGDGWFANGPMTESGKPHGQWETLYFEPELDSESRFYWYGEEVTEGEFHLREKR